MSEFNGSVPALGRQKARAGIGPPIALIRTLDDNATFEPEATTLTGGQVTAVAGRSNIVTAEDLVDLIIDALLPRLKGLIRSELSYQKMLDK